MGEKKMRVRTKERERERDADIRLYRMNRVCTDIRLHLNRGSRFVPSPFVVGENCADARDEARVILRRIREARSGASFSL